MRLLIGSAIAVALGCGGGGASPGSATFSGTIRGQQFAARDATAAVVSLAPNGVQGRVAVVGVTNSPAICLQLASGKEPTDARYLVLTLFRLQPDFSPAPPSAPGNYPVGGPTLENAGAAYVATDASCQLSTTVLATSGSVTLTSVGGRYKGTYDLFFEFGDHAIGSFDAPVCPGLSEFAEGKGTLKCQ